MTPGQGIGLLALCLLGSSAWLIEAIWPASSAGEILPGSAWQALHHLLLTAILWVAGRRHLSLSRLRSRPWLKLALASVLLFGLPAVLAAMRVQEVSQVTVTALFALAPVAVVVIVSSSGVAQTEADGANRVLASSLIGLAGALLLLPFAVPDSWRAVGGLAIVLAVVILVAFASVWLNRLLASFKLIEAAIVFCLANAVLSAAIFLLSGASIGSREGTASALVVEAVKAICFDLPQLVLLLWLMREVAPVRFAARFFVVPLLTVVEGVLLLRPEITFRSAAGATLLIFSAWHLVAGDMRREEPRLVLR